jgi:CBS domain-containing protein
MSEYENKGERAKDSLNVVQSLTFRDWWHLIARYTSVVDHRDTIGTVLKIMAHRGFRHLPVVDDGNLVGIVSAGDLIELFVQGGRFSSASDSNNSPSSPELVMKREGNHLVSCLHEPVSTITNSNPVTVSPDNTVLDAIRALGEKNIGSILILDHPSNPGQPLEKPTKGKLVGIVTLRDIVSILSAYGPFGVRVEDCMTSKVVAVNEMDSVYSAMELMTRERVRRLPVLRSARRNDGDLKSTIGMVTNKMILRYLESVISYEMLDVGRAIKQPVKTVMLSSMPLIDQKEDCGNAAYLMRELGTGGFAVVDSDGLIGVITERDLIRRNYQKYGLRFFSELFEKGNKRMQT